MSRDSRHRRKHEPQPTPWPQGLLVEAPPSPKPWRGRTWSNDNSWRTSLTANLTGEDSSSQESLADWQVVGVGRLYDGMGAGVGMGVGALNGTGIVGGRGASGEIEETPSASGARRRADGSGSGGGRALVNSDSGGSRVDDVGCNGCRTERRDAGIGWTTTGPDINHLEAVKLGNPVKGDAGVGHGCPPLAPAARETDFPQSRGIIGVGGDRNVGMRTEAYAGLPFADTLPKTSAGDAASAPKLREEWIKPYGGVPRWNDDRDGLHPVACPGSNALNQSDIVAPSEGECRLDGGRGTHGVMRSASRRDEGSVDLKCMDALSAVERERDAKGVFEANSNKEVTNLCGVKAAPEADAAATGRMISCDHVCMQPTRTTARILLKD